MANIVIAYHSGYHHTEAVALEVAKGAESAGASVIVHNVENPVERLWNDLAAADAIIFGCPTYMGSTSAGFKKFMEETVKLWTRQEWSGKLAAGFTNSGSLSGDKFNTLTDLAAFAAQHGMLWAGTGLVSDSKNEEGVNINRLGSWLGLMTRSENAPADQTPPQEDRAAARHFGSRIAGLAARWSAGKQNVASAA